MSKKRLSVLIAAIALQGCAAIEEARQSNKEIETGALKMRDAMKNVQEAAVIRTSAPRLAGDEITVNREEGRPAIFEKNIAYVAYGETLPVILSTLSQQTGLQISVQPNIRFAEAGAGQSAGSSIPGVPGMGMPQQTGESPFTIEWRAGTLASLLDHIAQRTGTEWRFKGGKVEFFTHETRTFHIYAPPGLKNVSSSISLSGAGGGGSGSSGGSSGGSTGGSGSGGGGSGTVSVSSSATIDPYESIARSIAAILGEDEVTGSQQAGAPGQSSGGNAAGGQTSGGSKSNHKNIIINAELGIITVTARPRVLERVAEFVENINARYARNIAIDVKVYSVDVSKSVDVGFSLQALHERMGKYSVALGAVNNAIRENRMIFDRQIGNTQSTLLFDALSSFGTTTLFRSGQVLAINGQPAPLQLADQVTYLASTQVAAAANASPVTSYTPGTYTVGFTANFLPLILGDNRILLQYQINISEDNGGPTTIPGSPIQAPRISTQNLQQQAFVRDGQTIVLFAHERNANKAEGKAGLTTVGRVGEQKRTLFVIVMEVHAGGES